MQKLTLATKHQHTISIVLSLYYSSRKISSYSKKLRFNGELIVLIIALNCTMYSLVVQLLAMVVAIHTASNVIHSRHTSELSMVSILLLVFYQDTLVTVKQGVRFLYCIAGNL